MCNGKLPRHPDSYACKWRVFWQKKKKNTNQRTRRNLYNVIDAESSFWCGTMAHWNDETFMMRPNPEKGDRNETSWHCVKWAVFFLGPGEWQKASDETDLSLCLAFRHYARVKGVFVVSERIPAKHLQPVPNHTAPGTVMKVVGLIYLKCKRKILC